MRNILSPSLVARRSLVTGTDAEMAGLLTLVLPAATLLYKCLAPPMAPLRLRNRQLLVLRVLDLETLLLLLLLR